MKNQENDNLLSVKLSPLKLEDLDIRDEHAPLFGMAISFAEAMSEWANDYIKQKTQNTDDL